MSRKVSNNAGNIREMTSETDVFSVVGGMWTTVITATSCWLTVLQNAHVFAWFPPPTFFYYMQINENDDENDATNRQEVDFKDEEVKTHRQSNGAKQPQVAMRRHHQ